MRNRKIRFLLHSAIIAVLLALTLFPIIWIVMTSLRTNAETLAVPPKIIFRPKWDSYAFFLSLKSPIISKLYNSIIIASGNTLAVIFISSMAAYSFSRFRFKGRFFLLFMILATRLLPPITAIVPLFLLMNSLRLVDTHLVMIIIYSALNIPFAIWMMKAFFDGISSDLEEAAKIDGCSWFQALYRITIPLAAPGMAATSIFVYLLAWNEFIFALIFTRTVAVTMPIAIVHTIGELGIYWQDMAVQVIIVMLPVFLFSFWMQKYLVRGLSAGALK